MGVGAGEEVVLVEDVQAVIAQAVFVVPWSCPWKGCKEYMENGAPQTYIDSHMRLHVYSRDKEQANKVKRDAARAQKIRAAGPSAQRRLNRKKDMAAAQRSAGKARGGTTKDKAKAGGGNAKGKGAGRGRARQ